MKRVDELGISPMPWNIAKHKDKENGVEYFNVNSYNSSYVADGTTMPDKHLIATAPRMYEEIYDAAVCLKFIVKKLEEGSEVLNLKDTLKSMSDRMERVLSKASGEEAK